MSVGLPPVPPEILLQPFPLHDPLWRFSVEQYHEMIRTGILTEDDPVELLEGLLVAKMPKKPNHRVVTRVTRDALQRLIPAGGHVESQEPITTDNSEPEPDISVIRGEPRQYREHHPGPQDLALVVEISDATLARDRGMKKRLYARAGIPVYWIVNLIDNQIEVYTDPTGPAEQPDYRQQHVFHREDQTPVMIQNQEVGRLAIAELLS